tara:strand:- start:27 stop:695 length:669 start_codon:yes stop_codon:yes gene_type:complete
MGAYTRLEAVNEMLLHTGESPVSDLTGSSGVDTSIAETILDQKTLDAQARGLANNVTIRTITADAQGVIYLPADTMSAELITSVETIRSDMTYARVTTRGWESGAAYFYNLTDGTRVFTPAKKYDLEVILQVSWVDMDTPIQKDITMQASRQYQMLSQGDGAVDNYLAQLEQYYGAKAKGADVRSKGFNTLFMQNNAFKAAKSRTSRTSSEQLRFWNSHGAD